jgi:energy-coupling factor transporter ATP-binding protein EcfA2
MITRIEIHGFKSFQDFVLDLEPFSALIGPNGAGKSNLLDALSLLGRVAAGDLATAFKEGRGRTQDQFARSHAEPVAVAKGYGTLATATFAVDASSRTSRRREVRLAAAIREHWDQCTIFVVHADGAGDPERALREQVEPGLALARSDHGALAAAACVPVREIEAWMLADPEPFGKLQIPLALPGAPETVPDPKRVFREIVASGSGGRLDSRLLYEFFGNNVSPTALRKLPAFCRFEAQLAEAITRAARP